MMHMDKLEIHPQLEHFLMLVVVGIIIVPLKKILKKFHVGEPEMTTEKSKIHPQVENIYRSMVEVNILVQLKMITVLIVGAKLIN